MVIESVQENVALESLVAQVADEFLERQRRGEKPKAEEYAVQHPEAADLLRKVLASLEVVGMTAVRGDPNEAAGDAVTGTLGDYRLLGEIGRGGMGIVYEAEQISLGRRVALKVLPFAATMDKRQLQRFVNEARAAGSLEHPHIVPVYGVGCERGVHYYAMRFIEGHSLDNLLQSLRVDQEPPETALTLTQPQAQTVQVRETARLPRGSGSALKSSKAGREDFRRIAELAIQAAEALEHAHQSGIVHRDVKPANLMLDDGGNLWITDFGLAQVQSDTRLTMTGDLVGTLRYMSPEQALAKRVIVDHRTDIYSLGATFYEVLTLKPVFAGQDRQELLRQIAFEEPVAPRKLNRAIPVELETVILKALDKNPADRYGTAKEMADDLQRFLKDEPTLARRPTLWQRGRKWARRHVAAVRASAAALVVVLIVLAATAGWLLRQQAEREVETQRAVDVLLQDAENLQKARKLPDAMAKVKQAAATLAAGASTADLDRRVQQRLADLKMAADLEEVRLRHSKGGTTEMFDNSRTSDTYAQLFRAFDIDMETLTPELAVQRIRERTVALEIAAALDDWARIIPRPSKRDLWMRLLAVAREVDPDPWRSNLRNALTQKDVEPLLRLIQVENLSPPTAVALAVALGGKNRHDEAIQVLRAAHQRDPSDFWINFQLGVEFRDRQTPQYHESIRFFTAAIALRPDSATTHNLLGLSFGDQGRLEEALVAYREAVRLNPNYAAAHNNVGWIHHELLHDYDGAIACFRKAILLKDNPLFPTNLGRALIKKGQWNEAIVAFQHAISLKKDYAEAYHHLGIAYAEKQQHDLAIDALHQAIAIKKDHYFYISLGNAYLLKKQPEMAIAALQESIALKKDDALAHYNLGIAYRIKLQYDLAIDAFQQAIAIKKEYAEAHLGLGAVLCDFKNLPDQAIDAFQKAIALKEDYAEAHFNLGIAYRNKGQFDQAIDAFQKAIAIKKDYAEAHLRLGIAYRIKLKYDQAIDAFQQAIAIKKDYAEAHLGLGAVLCDFKNQPDQAIDAFQKAIAVKKDYAEAHHNLGVAYAKKQEFDLAIAAFQQAITIKEDFAQAYFSLGLAYRDRRKYADALATFQQAQALTPENSSNAKLVTAALKEVEKILLLQNQLKTLTKVGQAEEFKGQLAKTDPLVQGKQSKIHSLQLSAGKQYLIDLMSKDFDTYLLVKDAAGMVLAEDDDGGEGTNSRLLFAPTTDGQYEIIVRAFQEGATGNYDLRVQEYQPTNADKGKEPPAPKK